MSILSRVFAAINPRIAPMPNVGRLSKHATRSIRGTHEPNRYLGKTKAGVEVYLLEGMRFYGAEAENWSMWRGKHVGTLGDLRRRG